MNTQPDDSEARTELAGTTQLLPLISRQQRLRESILALACGGMTIAMSTGLSMLVLLHMPQGGSLTPASMLPVLFCALSFGPAWGLVTCAVYGLMQFIIKPEIVHWSGIFLDYILAFGLLGTAGFFAPRLRERIAERNILRRMSHLSVGRMTAAVVVGMAGRLACHLLSGVIFYAEFAGEQNPWIYSLIYNGTYMLPEAILTALLMVYLASAFRPSHPGTQVR